MAEQHPPRKIVLAYSGGLDTSVILPWLKERYPGVKLVAFAAELGQGDELKGIEDKAYKSGADEVVVMDLRQEFAEKYCFPMLRAHAIYEQDYLLGTSIARPLIAAKQVEVARQTGADAVGHGATGKGNDQVRFELTYMALAPDLKIIAPWKDPTLRAARPRERDRVRPEAQRARSRSARRRSTARTATSGTSATRARRSSTPTRSRTGTTCLTMTVAAGEGARTRAKCVEVDFEAGNPIAVNGKKLAAHELIAELNKIGGKHGVGVTVLAENRLVGMKSRGVYETPGGTILYEAHKALEQICIERDTLHYKQQIALRYAELVYNGQWFHPLREALQTFIDHTNATVTGTREGAAVQGPGHGRSARPARTRCTTRNWPASAWKATT